MSDDFIPDFGENEQEIDLKALAEAASQTVYDAIQYGANSTPRSKQQQDHFIGISNLGHCRNYARLLMLQTPFSDERDKTAAFFGTAAGDAVEKAIQKLHPDWQTQCKGTFKLPSGGEIPGTADIVIPFVAQRPEDGIYQGVWDLKSKAELETIRIYGPSQQQVFQVHAYASAKIADGTLNADHPIFVADVFFDRSGRDIVPYTVFHRYTEDVIQFIDDWVNDVKYAVMQNEEASKDMPRDWCWSWCEYATTCRGNDTDVEGLIEDPEVIAAAEVHQEAAEIIKAQKKRQEQVKPTLEGKQGSTGKVNVRWIDYNETFIEGFTRKGYKKLDIKPVPGPKPPKIRAKKKAPTEVPAKESS
jgi:hypothetical protein